MSVSSRNRIKNGLKNVSLLLRLLRPMYEFTLINQLSHGLGGDRETSRCGTSAEAEPIVWRADHRQRRLLSSNENLEFRNLRNRDEEASCLIFVHLLSSM